MTMSEFQQLQKSEQVACLYEEAVYQGKKREGNQVVLLYQLESFYIEVYYKVYRTFISKIIITGSTMILDPYLEQMDMEDLVNEN